MQPISNPGNVSLQGEKTLETALSKTATSQTDDLPLTLAQRTSLEKLVMQISTLSGAKPAEVWATVRAELGTKNNAELLASQFPAAEQSLQNRLTTIQGSQDSRQLLQQLTSLLSQGNNRQAVSDFIRQQFGHTVLSSLTPSQLKLVVTLLQNGQLPQAATLLSIGGNTSGLPFGNTATGQPIQFPQTPTATTIPPPLPQTSQQLAALLQAGVVPDGLTANSSPAATALLDRALLPAEHNQLNQLVSKLVALTGESPGKVWQTLMDMQGLKTGDPIPAKNFQVLSQFLNTQSVLLQQHTLPTLHTLQAALKQPLDQQEQQLLQDFIRSTLNITPQTPLTPSQISDVVTFLYRRRLQQIQEAAAAPMQPFINPLIVALPQEWRSLVNKPIGLALVAILVVALLMWVVL
ncbi:flagella biosynthesis regulator Flk [Dickeya solani]|uniref:Flagellar assembly regulatory protein, Flk n=1 Tax=Dickeya solani D s0432-1 TaxID=1231725 RepID=A0AAV3K7H4_9GAMM|nr:flagella biosynthesis regulator Flk [Dickeya solani]ANE74220.1 flagella biosynthesis regulator [Dickeya solani IPO 2222]AUC41410.1 Putative flagellar assembly regulatory protein, Flk [Dickeya solani RNS 08.23.3.1.A]AUH10367.1 flagella biosynthesis regulator [Dickeya solani D s0432-1]AUH14306.1 flagella biosynthesis regulator [Dickeya solani]AYQ48668.1 Flagellar regulator flk [Dickeya solani]